MPKERPWVDLTNRHLLILDGHNSHVTLEVVKISMESGLDIVSFPSYTSHALQPLDIACFKPFKTAFRKIRDVWCLTNKNLPIGKQTLCEWTSTALKRALTATNIRVGFRRAGIWPLDQEASKSSMAPSTGFEEGVAGLESCGMTSATGHGAGGVTCLTDHPQVANGLVTGRASHVVSMDVDAACMHAAQTEEDGGDFSSDGDVDPIGPSSASEEEGALDAPDALPPRSCGAHWCALLRRRP